MYQNGSCRCDASILYFLHLEPKEYFFQDKLFGQMQQSIFVPKAA